MLCAHGLCPQSGSSGCFLGTVAGPVTCDVLDVIKTIEDCEWAPEEGGPPCMQEWEQCQYAMPGVIFRWGEEYIIATANGSFCGGGASVGSEEVGPAMHGAEGWVLQVPTMFGRCGDAVSEEKPYSSIGHL